MADSLFTFILDYDGGTYICQYEAEDEFAVAKIYGQELACGRVLPERVAMPVEYVEGIRESCEAPVPLDGLIGAWCIEAMPEYTLNVVRTARP